MRKTFSTFPRFSHGVPLPCFLFAFLHVSPPVLMMRRVGRVHTSATPPSPLPPPPHRAYCLPPLPSVSLILRIPIATAPIYMYVRLNAILLSLDTSLDCRIYRPPLMTETVAGGGRASPPIADHLSALSPARVHHRRPYVFSIRPTQPSYQYTIFCLHAFSCHPTSPQTNGPLQGPFV